MDWISQSENDCPNQDCAKGKLLRLPDKGAPHWYHNQLVNDIFYGWLALGFSGSPTALLVCFTVVLYVQTLLDDLWLCQKIWNYLIPYHNQE